METVSVITEWDDERNDLLNEIHDLENDLDWEREHNDCVSTHDFSEVEWKLEKEQERAAVADVLLESLGFTSFQKRLIMKSGDPERRLNEELFQTAVEASLSLVPDRY